MTTWRACVVAAAVIAAQPSATRAASQERLVADTWLRATAGGKPMARLPKGAAVTVLGPRAAAHGRAWRKVRVSHKGQSLTGWLSLWALPWSKSDPSTWDYGAVKLAFDVVARVRDVDLKMWRGFASFGRNNRAYRSYDELLKRYTGGTKTLPGCARPATGPDPKCIKSTLEALFRLHVTTCTWQLTHPGTKHHYGHSLWYKAWQGKKITHDPVKMIAHASVETAEMWIKILRSGYAKWLGDELDAILKPARVDPGYRDGPRILLAYMAALASMNDSAARRAAIEYQKMLTILNVTSVARVQTGDRGPGLGLLRQLHNFVLMRIRSKLEKSVHFGISKVNRSWLGTDPGEKNQKRRRLHIFKTQYRCGARWNWFGELGHHYGALDLSPGMPNDIKVTLRKQIRLDDLPVVQRLPGLQNVSGTTKLTLKAASLGTHWPLYVRNGKRRGNNHLTLLIAYANDRYEVVFKAYFLHSSVINSTWASKLKAAGRNGRRMKPGAWIDGSLRLPINRPLSVGKIGKEAADDYHLHLTSDFELCDRKPGTGQTHRAQCSKSGCAICESVPPPVCRSPNAKRLFLGPASSFAWLGDWPAAKPRGPVSFGAPLPKPPAPAVSKTSTQSLIALSLVTGRNPGNACAATGATLINVDLNKGAGGAYLYFCKKLGRTGKPITDVSFAVGGRCPGGWVKQPGDLNAGTQKRRPIALCTRQRPGAPPIRDITAVWAYTAEKATCPSGFQRIHTDLNKGVQGRFIYACISRGAGR